MELTKYDLEQKIKASQTLIRIEQLRIEHWEKLLGKATPSHVEIDPNYNPWDRLIGDIKTDAEFRAAFGQEEEE